ncbi:MocE family 2Fe-2S type ferredoxin [Bradyrhizobium sp. PMVTL-01]|uniref:MocE family 2Fe-2S type ferredoxin n=1 Tax=Bradyrhizobium sp. PMVTL-01 TaxID=3434999 RepID=UPI003F6F0C86
MSLEFNMVDDTARTWVFACKVDDIRLQDVRRWEFDGHSYAIFRSPKGEIFVTDDICTHEHAHLSDGYVEGHTVECPRHSGRFSYMTGKALGAPVCINLCTYQVRVVDGGVNVLVPRRA